MLLSKYSIHGTWLLKPEKILRLEADSFGAYNRFDNAVNDSCDFRNKHEEPT